MLWDPSFSFVRKIVWNYISRYSNSLSNATLSNAVLGATRISFSFKKPCATLISLNNAGFFLIFLEQHWFQFLLRDLQYLPWSTRFLSYTVIFSAQGTALLKELLYINCSSTYAIRLRFLKFKKDDRNVFGILHMSFYICIPHGIYLTAVTNHKLWIIIYSWQIQHWTTIYLWIT